MQDTHSRKVIGFFVAIGVLVLAAFAFFHARKQLAWTRQNWISTPGIVIGSPIMIKEKVRTRNRQVLMIRAELPFTYSAGGFTYEGKVIGNPNGELMTKKEYEEFVEHVKISTAIVVKHNEIEPATAFADFPSIANDTISPRMILIGSYLGFVLGIVVFVSAFRS